MTHMIAARPTGSIDRARILVFLLAQIAAASLPAVGFGTPIGESFDRANTLITPAGWAFSIWGALYFGSVVFALYQALPAQRENSLVAALRRPAVAAFLGNTLWRAMSSLMRRRGCGRGASATGFFVRRRLAAAIPVRPRPRARNDSFFARSRGPGRNYARWRS